MERGSLAASPSDAARERPESPSTAAVDDIEKLLRHVGAEPVNPSVAPSHHDLNTVIGSPASRHCASGEPDSSVKTTNGAYPQRKNAATKLQHSGLATVVVYHNRHRVVHHNDRHVRTRPSVGVEPVSVIRAAVVGEPGHGPDFADRMPTPSCGHGCMLAQRHRCRDYLVVDLGWPTLT